MAATVCRHGDVVSSEDRRSIIAATKYKQIWRSTLVLRPHDMIGIAFAVGVLTSLVMITVEGLTIWIVLAFALWIAITPTLQYVLRLKGAGIAAAILSWLIAGAAMSMMSPVLHWLRSHLPA